MVVKLYSSLGEYFNIIRNTFDCFEKNAVELGGCSLYLNEKKKRVKKK